jgi:hypothetical protein
MKKIVNKLIDECVVGVDTYTHVGSTWLIFTESKQWVIELTESKTLWYNYNFFNNIFNYASMDVVENQHYITQWVEDNIINVVKDTILEQKITEGEVEGIIEMGVKQTNLANNLIIERVEDTIDNGVKVTLNMKVKTDWSVEDTIENGVKETSSNVMMFQSMKVEDTIQNGVKETKEMEEWVNTPRIVGDVVEKGVKETRLEMNITEGEVDDIIQDGVKLTQFNDNENKSWVEGVIKKGIKETKVEKRNGIKDTQIQDTIQNGVRHTLNTEYMPKSMVEDIIENGVKETKTPGNGDIVSTVEWLKENNSNSYPKLIEDVIENGVKKTMLRQNITDGNVETIIETGIKETQPLPDQSGELIGYGNYYHGKEDRTKAFYNYLEETIKFGVKENLG